MKSFQPRLVLAAATLTLSVFSANAASVKDCGDDYKANVQNLAEPWEKNTQTFLNGSVRIAVVDTGGEPVCCSTENAVPVVHKVEFDLKLERLTVALPGLEPGRL